MKKILIFAAAAVVLGFASCGKKSAPAEEVADSIVVDTVYINYPSLKEGDCSGEKSNVEQARVD